MHLRKLGISLRCDLDINTWAVKLRRKILAVFCVTRPTLPKPQIFQTIIFKVIQNQKCEKYKVLTSNQLCYFLYKHKIYSGEAWWEPKCAFELSGLKNINKIKFRPTDPFFSRHVTVNTPAFIWFNASYNELILLLSWWLRLDNTFNKDMHFKRNSYLVNYVYACMGFYGILRST